VTTPTGRIRRQIKKKQQVKQYKVSIELSYTPYAKVVRYYRKTQITELPSYKIIGRRTEEISKEEYKKELKR